MELLTTTRIERLACEPGQRDRLVFDSKQRGLAVRITASGGKTYLAQYTRGGKKHRVALGACSAISLAQARSAAQAVMGDVAHGKDPAAERRAVKAKATSDELSLAQLIARWQTLHLHPKRARSSYVKEVERALSTAFENRLSAPAASLTRTMVVHTLDRITEAGSPIMAARVMSYGRACYRWGVGRDMVAINPFVGIQVTPANKRERVLADEEIVALWRATEGPGAFNAIVRVLLLTGQRRDEVAETPWSELSSDLSTWTIPGGPDGRTKNKRTHIVPLSRQAREIIDAQPRLNDNPFVFAGLRGKSFRGFSNAKANLARATGIEKRFTLHDLRRTVATNMQKLGVRLEVTEAILNHASGSRAGIVGVYQRHDWADEKRAALQAWADRLDAIVEGRLEPSNVVTLRA
jgi:integrase